MESSSLHLIYKTADMVKAYVSHNAVRPADIPDLIGSVHKALVGLSVQPAVPEPAVAPPALPHGVTVKNSVQQDHLICLEDGRRFKSLKRHLRTQYGLSPADYRARWGLDDQYPMVAPTYAEQRSALAKQFGLGVHRKAQIAAAKAAAAGSAPSAPAATPKRKAAS